VANFRTRARAVDLLGKQQIRDEVTAISELLRNSYDAYASEGLVDVNTKQSRIVVWDDGDGMDENELQENWLTLGTYSKYYESGKNKKGRTKIGEKGIGRLAISLLGDQLLLISKKRLTGVWSLLYLHWELFRNERYFLEEIKIPTRLFASIDELTAFLKNDFNFVQAELLANLTNKNKWIDEKKNSIISEINSFQVTEEIFGLIRIIEKRNGGTLFYIKNIENTSWDWNLYKSKIEDESLKKRSQRLKDVIFSFQNVIDIYDKMNCKQTDDVNEAIIGNKTFTPKIHVDGYRLEDQTWFNQSDVVLYDYALKGEISNFKFNGQAYINGLNGIEEWQTQDISLTQGINIRSESLKDCGPITIKWYFVEGKSALSSLSKDQHKLITDKLDNIGGIYVFRDGLRILPYGEPGNDFLNMEERRSKGTGYYLFSFRRMYGFMEISKANNPNLIDKSSREGFIENSYYNYFRAVAINLLIWWARDFLESRNKEGRRLLRYKRLLDERAQIKKQIEKQKLEEAQEREYFINLEQVLIEFSEVLDKRYHDIKSYIQSQIDDQNTLLNDIALNRIEIKDKLFSIKSRLYYKADELDDLRVKPNLRYNHSPDLIDLIQQNNENLEEKKEDLKSYINNSIISFT
jgi:hypothetical protein